MKRGDICGSGDPTTCSDGKLDLDVLAVDTFNAAKGYEAAFDLVGADTYTVAYATLVVTEGKTSTKAELDWDDVGAVWEGDLGDAPEGLVAVKATTYDSRGKKLDSAKVEVAAPWADGGAGVPALPTDEDPYTSLTVRDVKELADILKNTYGIEPAALTVVSDGWNAGDTLPVDASVELTNGTTLNVPVNSYQITSLTTLSADFSEAVDTWFAKGGSSVTLTVEGGLDLLVIDSSGSISNDDYVREPAFSKGKFYGSFTRNDDGDLGLVGADKDAVSPRGDILIGGEPIGFELTDTNKDGVITGPPAIVFRTTGNGKGTRAVATTNTGKPPLL